MPLSAGLLLYRRRGGRLQVLLAHPGGPFYSRRDAAVWSIPKGEVATDEAPLATACREFREETGFDAVPPFLSLGEVRQRGGKRVQAWAFEGDCDPARLASNTFELEWPPHSGRVRRFPEVDRADFFEPAEARVRINPGQRQLLDRLIELVGNSGTDAANSPADPGPQEPG